MGYWEHFSSKLLHTLIAFLKKKTCVCGGRGLYVICVFLSMSVGLHIPWHTYRGQRITPSLFGLCQARWILRTLFLPPSHHRIDRIADTCYRIRLCVVYGDPDRVLMLVPRTVPIESSLWLPNGSYSSEILY